MVKIVNGLISVHDFCFIIQNTMSEMNDTTPEITKLLNEKWKRRTPQERTKTASLVFVSARKIILATMPENLSEAERQRYIYERTYGESLPADFPFRRN
jgi:hypothetical protein